MQNNELYYPELDINGDFEVQGKKYSMVKYVCGGESDEE